jgi:hypothetical protein
MHPLWAQYLPGLQDCEGKDSATVLLSSPSPPSLASTATPSPVHAPLEATLQPFSAPPLTLLPLPPPHCVDRVLNSDESDVDCGGSECAPCAAGLRCLRDADCGVEISSSGALEGAPPGAAADSEEVSPLVCGVKRERGVLGLCQMQSAAAFRSQEAPQPLLDGNQLVAEQAVSQLATTLDIVVTVEGLPVALFSQAVSTGLRRKVAAVLYNATSFPLALRDVFVIVTRGRGLGDKVPEASQFSSIVLRVVLPNGTCKTGECAAKFVDERSEQLAVNLRASVVDALSLRTAAASTAAAARAVASGTVHVRVVPFSSYTLSDPLDLSIEHHSMIQPLSIDSAASQATVFTADNIGSANVIRFGGAFITALALAFVAVFFTQRRKGSQLPEARTTRSALAPMTKRKQYIRTVH